MKRSHLLSSLCTLFLFSASVDPVLVCAETLPFDISIIPNTISGRGGTAYDINNNSQIVGIFTLLNGSARGFLYDNNIVTDLGALNDDWPVSEARGINENGVIVGGSVYITSNSHPFKYENSQMYDLGYFNDPSEHGEAWAINNHGQIVGNSDGRPFIYENSSMNVLNGMNLVFDINDNGQIVGNAGSGFSIYAAMYENASIIDLGTLGGLRSWAYGLNNLGQVVGGSYINNVDDQYHAFLYDNRSMIDLGTLGGEWSDAWGVNNLGQVVGYSETSSGGQGAFLWVNGIMYALDDLGGTNSRAYAINDKGVIVGRSRDVSNNENHAVVWSPAVPNTTSVTIDIEKLTNGNQADVANDSSVPHIAPGETVTWTYLVTNTGEVEISGAVIIVTDSQSGITPILDTATDVGNDLILSLGETWTYSASSLALGLVTPPAKVTVVPGCNDGRNTYQNTGRVEIIGTNISDDDLSHYCSSDADGDGIQDSDDNCPLVANPSQLDTDTDDIGNECDNDDDNDGVPDSSDAFPLDSSESVDTDSDGIGNNADPDDDNDGAPDGSDAFPLDPSEFLDTDGDGIGNNGDTDDDNDGTPDSSDAFPLDPTETVDTDNDGTGNNADTDDDNDGTPDISDAFPLDPLESVDTDNDGIGNNADPDDDNDGLSDTEESVLGSDPLNTDTDNDGLLDGDDNCPIKINAGQLDADNDGLGDACDNCPDDARNECDQLCFPVKSSKGTIAIICM